MLNFVSSISIFILFFQLGVCHTFGWDITIERVWNVVAAIAPIKTRCKTLHVNFILLFSWHKLNQIKHLYEPWIIKFIRYFLDNVWPVIHITVIHPSASNRTVLTVFARRDGIVLTQQREYRYEFLYIMYACITWLSCDKRGLVWLTNMLPNQQLHAWWTFHMSIMGSSKQFSQKKMGDIAPFFLSIFFQLSIAIPNQTTLN